MTTILNPTPRIDITPADARTDLQTLMDEFFRAVSFESGQTPAYAGIHELFVDGSRLIRNNSDVPEISTIDEFIASRQQTVDAGALTSFQEIETAEITEVFGNVAHRFSTYVKHGTMKGSAFKAKGVISTQFIRTPKGWRMNAMAWDDERPDLTIPPLRVTGVRHTVGGEDGPSVRCRWRVLPTCASAPPTRRRG